MIINRLSVTTIGLAIALSMGGCAAPADDPEPANAPADEATSQDETGEVSSAMWGAAPIAAPVGVGLGACGGLAGGGFGFGWGGIGAVPTVGFGAPLGLGWGGLGCGAPAIGFREEAEGESAPKE